MLSGDMSTGLLVAIVGVVAFLAIAIVLSRNTARQKKAAIASLKEEEQLIGHYDIMAMANEEIEQLGLRSISGAEGLSADVLLRTWKDTPDEVRTADRENLRYVVAENVDRANATADQVTLERTDE